MHCCMSGDAQKKLLGYLKFPLPTFRINTFSRGYLSIWNPAHGLLCWRGQTDRQDRQDTSWREWRSKFCHLFVLTLGILSWEEGVWIFVTDSYFDYFQAFKNIRPKHWRRHISESSHAINNHRNGVTGIVSHLPGGHLPPPKFGHFPPPNSDISHTQKKTFARRTTATPNFFSSFFGAFFLAFSTYTSWRTTRMGRRGAWWGGHGAHQVEGAWRGGHGAHQVGGGYHGGHGGRHGGGKVGWALCFCSWRLGSHISKEGGGGGGVIPV